MPGLGTILVGGTGLQVDYRFPADLDKARHHAPAVIEQGGERFTYRFELKFVMTLNLH